MISTNENLLLWEQRINERNKSGMTVKEWCKKMKSVKISIIIVIKCDKDVEFVVVFIYSRFVDCDCSCGK